MAKSHQIVRKAKFLWTDKLLNSFFLFETKMDWEQKKKKSFHTLKFLVAVRLSSLAKVQDPERFQNAKEHSV